MLDGNFWTFCFGKVHCSKFGNFSEITVFFELAKILRKSLERISCFFGQKTLFLGQKTLFLDQKVWKKIGNLCCGVNNSHFPKIQNLKKFQNLFYSELSKNYEKMTFNSNFENREKLVPTQKPTQMFGLKFGMQGLIVICSHVFDKLFFTP